MRNYIINSLNLFENQKNNTTEYTLYYSDDLDNVPSFQTLLTPVIFNTEICKQFDTTYNIEVLLNGTQSLAEFALYACYLLYNNLQDEYIQTRQHFSLTLYDNTPNRELLLQSLSEDTKMIEQPYSILGISSTLFGELTLNEQNHLKNIWITQKLCTQEEAERLIKIQSMCTKTAYQWTFQLY
jgi:hypothetical protein